MVDAREPMLGSSEPAMARLLDDDEIEEMRLKAKSDEDEEANDGGTTK